MGGATRPLYDAGNHRSLERQYHRQSARSGTLTLWPTTPETKRGPALLHHRSGHDREVSIDTDPNPNLLRIRHGFQNLAMI